MAKAKTGNPVDAVGKLVAVLERLESADRTRVVQAAWTLLGDDGSEEALPSPARGKAPLLPSRLPVGEKAYFDTKEPRSKGEELAVAARYLEEKENATTSKRADLERVIKAARRNFDGRNFRRDLDNARTAALFTRGTGRDSIVLAAYGQSYVDTLPNREALKNLKPPRRVRRGGRKKTKTRKHA